MIQVDTHSRGNVCIKANERFRFLTRSYLFTQSFKVFLYNLFAITGVICAWTVHNLGFEETTYQFCENWKLKLCLVRILTTRKWAWRKQNLLKGKAFGSDLSILQDVLGFIQHLLLRYGVAEGRGLQHQECSSAAGTF